MNNVGGGGPGLFPRNPFLLSTHLVKATGIEPASVFRRTSVTNWHSKPIADSPGVGTGGLEPPTIAVLGAALSH